MQYSEYTYDLQSLMRHFQYIYIYKTKNVTDFLLSVLNNFGRMLAKVCLRLINSFEVYAACEYIIYYPINVDQPRKPFEGQSAL